MRAARILAVTLFAAALAACNDSDSQPTPPQTAAVAKLRVIHASPTAANVDIHVTAPGASISSLTPTPTGTKTAAIGPADITVNGGGLYTIVARDPLPGSTALGLILLDDFAS